MPRLGKPCLPILIAAEDAVAQVKEMLAKNNWKEEETKIEKPALVFLPFWFFHFDSFREETDPESQEKSTTEGDRGTAALDAISGDVDDAVPPLFDTYSDQLTTKSAVEHFKIERSHFRDTEVQKLAQLRMAAKLSIPKDDVVISGVRLVYLPVWIISAVFEDNEMDFEIEAVEGALVSEEEVPFKGHTASELARET
ncbi:MAG: hypothetical protein Q7R47_05085, partial [Candidatus Diapherotrites archaeon]|nr:hypothetical protein [Candidatus Diapherotrites archaeon]